MTWLKTSSPFVALAPPMRMTATAGTMATSLVNSRLATGLSRILTKPSMTICPARVAVRVEFMPHAMRAMAKSLAASALPSRGAINR